MLSLFLLCIYWRCGKLVYIIKNVSKDNIVVGKISMRPDSEIQVNDIEPYVKMIKTGYLSVKDISNNSQNNKNLKFIKKQNDITNKFIDNTMKKNVMESFFNFYLSKDVSEKDLEILKWFYTNIGFTKDIKKSTLELLENAEHYEDLAVVLLNNIYPELLELYSIDTVEENKN